MFVCKGCSSKFMASERVKFMQKAYGRVSILS